MGVHMSGIVIVWRFDRFAGSTIHLLTALEEFRRLGVEFHLIQREHGHEHPNGGGYVYDCRRHLKAGEKYHL